MKKCFILLLVLCTLCLPALADSDRVVDDANLLSSWEETQLQEKIDAIRDTYHMDVAIVTQKDIGLQPIDVYTADFFENADYGFGKTKDGIIFLIDMGDREFFSATHGTAIIQFDDVFLDAMHQEIVPLLSQGAYSEAFFAYTDGIEAQLAKVYSAIPTPASSVATETQAAIPTIFASIFPLIPFLMLIIFFAGGVM